MRSERTPMGGAERGGLWINVLSGPYGRGFEALCAARSLAGRFSLSRRPLTQWGAIFLVRVPCSTGPSPCWSPFGCRTFGLAIG
jgi:hypothetical protein